MSDSSLNLYIQNIPVTATMLGKWVVAVEGIDTGLKGTIVHGADGHKVEVLSTDGSLKLIALDALRVVTPKSGDQDACDACVGTNSSVRASLTAPCCECLHGHNISDEMEPCSDCAHSGNGCEDHFTDM